MATRHSPDIIVHTGDLFHSHDPHPDDLNFVLNLLKKLDSPVILLDGNHDVPYGYRYSQSPVRLLENAGLVTSTGGNESRTLKQEVDGKEIEFHLVPWTRNRLFQNILSNFSPSTDLSILLAHHVPMRKDELPSHYDYIGYGHSHNFYLDEEYSIGCPGSTCVVDWKKEMGGKSKLIVADIDSNGAEFNTETLNDVREFKYHPGLDITGMDASDANDAIKGWLETLSPKKKGKPIIILNVKGIVTPETENGIERGELIAFGESTLNPLFLHIEPNWEVIGPPEIKLSTPLDIEVSLKEYLDHSEFEETDRVLSELEKIVGEN